MAFELVEPVRILFKDEVRVVGDELGLPHDMVYRQPFPGPGLGVRCPGAITRDRLEAVRESDAILREEFDKNGLAGKIWQYFTVVPEFRSTGIKNGKRAFEWCCIVRAVCSTDVMTATAAEIPHEVMPRVIKRICSSIKTPIIAGGLITDKEDVMAALSAGAIAVSSTNHQVWKM